MVAKLEYKLKQETPMIHFQYDEAGACIRGSELKPKLDRFILKKKDGNVPDSWYRCDNGGNRTNYSLNYKVTIKTLCAPKISRTAEKDIETFREVEKLGPKPRKEDNGYRDYIDKKKIVCNEIKAKYKDYTINGMYFGNMASQKDKSKYIQLVEDNYRESVFYPDGIIVEFVCLVSDLRQYIDDIIDEFFAVTNFGTRQDKGFGSFYIDGGKDIIKTLSGKKYSYFYTNYKGNYEDKLNVVSILYSMMKGGINQAPVYVKGYIQRQYLDDLGLKNVGSDKAFTKSTIKPAQERPKEKNGYPSYKFVRALLGAGDHLEFRDKDGLRNGVVNISSTEAERFKSPITVKIVGDNIVFILDESYKNILGKEYIFEDDASKKNDTIIVPESFDPDFFIEHFMTYYGKKKNELKKNKRFAIAAELTLMKGVK